MSALGVSMLAVKREEVEVDIDEWNERLFLRCREGKRKDGGNLKYSAEIYGQLLEIVR